MIQNGIYQENDDGWTKQEKKKKKYGKTEGIEGMGERQRDKQSERKKGESKRDRSSYKLNWANDTTIKSITYIWYRWRENPYEAINNYFRSWLDGWLAGFLFYYYKFRKGFHFFCRTRVHTHTIHIPYASMRVPGRWSGKIVCHRIIMPAIKNHHYYVC